MEYGKGCEGCTMCKGSKEINGYINNKSYCRKCANAMCREYKRKNREKISTYNEKYKKENKEDISEYNKKYHLENKMEITLRQRFYFALKDIDRKKSIIELLGCSIDIFEEWMKFQFTEEMTSDNHGSVWQIDHLIPCSKFKLDKLEE
jgi:hypothetical protein